MNRRKFLAAAVAVTLAVPAFANSAPAPFSADAFEAAQTEGRPILVHVTAPWCGTCRAQKKVLPGLLASPSLSGILWLEIDFDSQEELRETFGVRHQSTTIMFRGREEVARAVGETDPDALRELLSKAL